MNKLLWLVLLFTLFFTRLANSQEQIQISALLRQGFEVVAAHDSGSRAVIFLKKGGDLYRCETTFGAASMDPPRVITTNQCTLIR